MLQLHVLVLHHTADSAWYPVLQRYLFMKLTYNDNAPDSYQPPLFETADESIVGHFSRKPFCMYGPARYLCWISGPSPDCGSTYRQVGTVDTEHHKVLLKVKTVLDGEDDRDNDEEGMDEALVEKTAALHWTSGDP
jgi:hypothetical protein